VFYYSAPFFTTKYFAWLRLGQINTYTQARDFLDKVYCYPRGYGVFGIIKEFLDNKLIRFERPNNMQGCFKMLHIKRVDFIVTSTDTALKVLQGLGKSSSDVQKSSFSVSKVSLHLLVSKQLPNAQVVIDTFNNGLNTLQENGRYEALIEEFDWKE